MSMLHMLHAKETGARMIVVDRVHLHRGKADEYVRIRWHGHSVPVWPAVHVFKNGWEDKEIHQ